MDTTTVTIMGQEYKLESPGFVRARQIGALFVQDQILGDYAALLLACPRLRAKVKIPDYSAVIPLAVWVDEYAPKLTETKNASVREQLQQDVVRATVAARGFVWSLIPSPKEVEERADFFEPTDPGESAS